MTIATALVLVVILVRLTQAYDLESQPTRVSQITLIETTFTTNLNGLIRGTLPAAAKESTFVNEKVWRDAVDKTVYKTKDAKGIPLTVTQAQELRDLIQRRVDALNLKSDQPGNVMKVGTLQRDFFMEKISPPTQR